MPPGGRLGGPGGHFMTEEEKAAQPKITRKLIKRVFSYLRPYWRQLLLVLICIMLPTALQARKEKVRRSGSN